MERFYFDKLWRRDRNGFRHYLKEWWQDLTPLERRKIVLALIKEGKRAELFNHEINFLLKRFFRVSDLLINLTWRVRSVLSYPTWLLRIVYERYKTDPQFRERRDGIFLLRKAIYKELDEFIPHTDLYMFLKRMNPEEVLRAKENHDKAFEKALKNVGRVEGSFLHELENGGRIRDVYEKYAVEFRKLDLHDLLYWIVECSYYTALIDSAVLDKLAEMAGVETPCIGLKLGRWIENGL